MLPLSKNWILKWIFKIPIYENSLLLRSKTIGFRRQINPIWHLSFHKIIRSNTVDYFEIWFWWSLTNGLCRYRCTYYFVCWLLNWHGCFGIRTFDYSAIAFQRDAISYKNIKSEAYCFRRFRIASKSYFNQLPLDGTKESSSLLKHQILTLSVIVEVSIFILPI